jgi:hypothetical protein
MSQVSDTGRKGKTVKPMQNSVSASYETDKSKTIIVKAKRPFKCSKCKDIGSVQCKPPDEDVREECSCQQ